MTIEAFREFERANPFLPFAIHLADGREFVARHREAAALNRSGRILMVMNVDGMIEVIDMLLVISLRPIAGTDL